MEGIEIEEIVKQIEIANVMTKEWSEKNKYTSFNSWKGLAYIDHYRAIAEGEFLPPIEASIDLVADCQLSCRWCNSYSFLRPGGSLYDSMKMRKMPPARLRDLVEFLLDWGVKGFCLGGGGDPSLHESCPDIIQQIIERRREVAFVTNGISISDNLIDALSLCRWIGFSIDAGNAKEYQQLKGLDVFWRVLGNLERLVTKTGPGCDISYKFLIVPENYCSLADACRLAKDIGVREFHARPASVERREIFNDKEVKWNIEEIQEFFGRCHQMETESFRVITSFHKVSSDFGIANNFSRCWASALQIQCCADGGIYLCQDQRIKERYRLGSHWPEPKKILDFWGSDSHIEMMKSVNPSQDCCRCTFKPYQEQIEKAVIEDSMCLNFP